MNNSEATYKKMLFWLRLVLFMAFLAILSVLIYANIYPSGRLIVEHKIGMTGPCNISPLEPRHRVLAPEIIAGQKAQALISNPVYFNLRTVLPFRKAKIRIVYRNPENYNFRIGGLVNNDLWQFDFKEVEVVSQEGDWLTGQAEFDTSFYYRDDNKYRFILAVPYQELEDFSSALAVHRIDIELERDPMTFKLFFSKLFNKIKNKLGFYEEIYLAG